jgi:hypothetical protein
MEDLGDTCGDYPSTQLSNRGMFGYQDIGVIFDAIPLVSGGQVIAANLSLGNTTAFVCMGQHPKPLEWAELDQLGDDTASCECLPLHHLADCLQRK